MIKSDIKNSLIEQCNEERHSKKFQKTILELLEHVIKFQNVPLNERAKSFKKIIERVE